jgi:hypothetical protein
MINDDSLALTELGSLNGLVAFTCTLFPTITTVDALMILLENNANLHAAVKLAKQRDQNPSVPDSHADDIAAFKTRHPDPSLLAELAAGLMPAVDAALKDLAKPILSPGDIQNISKSLLENHPPRVPQVPGLFPPLTTRAPQIISARIKKFKARQELIRKMVETALQEHARRQGVGLLSYFPAVIMYYCISSDLSNFFN